MSCNAIRVSLANKFSSVTLAFAAEPNRMTNIKPETTQRSTSWKLRSQTIEFGQLPKLMGIVNVTPDSFSDGGNFYATQAAVDHALRLEDQGCDILDIGGESTRPYSQPVTEAEELDRVIPVIERLIGRVSIPISVDTSKCRIAAAAIEMGAQIINDVTGLSGDPGMLEVAAQSQAGVCAMHMQGTPQTMQENPQYSNVVADILVYLKQRRDALVASGIDIERVCLDPGIGFGKTHQHNIELLKHVGQFHSLGCPILVGHSRKGMIGKVLGDNETSRVAGTIGLSLALAIARIQILRVHDVAENRQALLLFQAAGALD
jgi:dihydropteroate synthase